MPWVPTPDGPLLPPLPDPDAPVVHVHTRAAGSLGTISRRDLDGRIHRGEVAPDDVFWFPGMGEWGEVRHHPELFTDLAPVGPPASVLSDVMVALPGSSEVVGSTVASVGHHPSEASEPPEPQPVEVQSSATWIADDTSEVARPSWETLPPEPGDLALDADALVPTDTEMSYAASESGESLESEAEPVTYAPKTDEDVRMDAIFDDLMQATHDYREAHEFASCIDEVFLGAVITAGLDAGRALTDLTSDGTHHFLRFVSPDDGSRVLLRVTHLTGNLTTSRVQGHMASVVVGYGERMARFAEIWASLGEAGRSGIVPRDTPGALVIDGDVASQYVYVQVRLYLRIDDYVQRDWSIDYDRLSEHISACVRALRIHLHGRFGGGATDA
mgnify:CR=1 FL=1